jgi:hypothetical protein
MKDHQQALRELAAYFPKESESKLKKGGASLTYIPVGEVIARANEVLGFGWSFEVVDTHLDGDWITAHVRLRVSGTSEEGHYSSTRDGFGGQKIKYTKAGSIVDLGDEFKGAVSDALKKAFQSFGVALYLARDESLESTFEKAAGAKDDGHTASPSGGDITAPVAISPEENQLQEARKALAVRAKSVGLSAVELREVASEVLKKPITKASDLESFFDVEAVDARLDELQTILKEAK